MKDESLTYFPNPISGGADKANAIEKIVQILLESQMECFIGKCHDRWSKTTDRYRIIAIPVIVNNDIIPKNNISGMIYIQIEDTLKFKRCNLFLSKQWYHVTYQRKYE